MNIDIFFQHYERQLTIAVQTHPQDYCFGVDRVLGVVMRMRTAVEAGTYNKAGRGFIQTCKVLGIPHTYKAIDAFCGVKRQE